MKKRSPLAIISLIAGIMLAVPAVLIAIIDLLRLTESDLLVVLAFPIVAIFSMPEALVQMLPVPPPLPVVLPLIAFLAGAASIIRKEPARRLAQTGIVLAAVAMAIHTVNLMLS